MRATEPCPPTSIPALLCREGQGPLEILQLDFEMENFTSQSVKRRIMWHIDYRGHSALPDLERAVTELTVIQRDVQAILPLAMVSRPWETPPQTWRVVRLGRTEHMSIWNGQGGKQGRRTTSEGVLMNQGVYTFMGGKCRAALGEVIREEFSGKGCLGEFFWMMGVPLSF